MKKLPVLSTFFLSTSLLSASTFCVAEAIDASDPTKISSYVGVGAKYTSYTNDQSLKEIRAVGNLGLSKKDMFMFEVGYGENSKPATTAAPTPVKNEGQLTNSRLRWFHLAEMDSTVSQGYRGWGTQVDLQLAGELPGTDGQNSLSAGFLAAFGLGGQLNFYFPVSVLNSWDKDFKEDNGSGVNVAPLLVFSPNYLWQGSYFQIWPNYTRFVSGNLKDEGSGMLTLSTGGLIINNVMWSLTADKHVDRDLRSYRRNVNNNRQADWSGFLNVSAYF